MTVTAALQYSDSMDKQIGAPAILWEAWAIVAVTGMAMWLGIAALFV